MADHPAFLAGPAARADFLAIAGTIAARKALIGMIQQGQAYLGGLIYD
jgi:hypothetical protein